MPAESPTERSLRARVAAYAMHSQGKTNTVPASRAMRQKFEREVDPEGVLAPAVRATRAEFARKRYYTELARRAAKARWGKREAKKND